MANKVEIFIKIKEIHHRIGTAVPQILVSTLLREVGGMTLEDLTRNLATLEAMGLIKLKGTAKGAIELTKSGLTTTMKFAVPRMPEAAPEPEKV